jgi:hypothetical protein
MQSLHGKLSFTFFAGYISPPPQYPLSMPSSFLFFKPMVALPILKTILKFLFSKTPRLPRIDALVPAMVLVPWKGAPFTLGLLLNEADTT